MSDLNLRGGTVVTAEASFRADVAVRGGRVAAVGTTIPDDDVETVDCTGRLLMPGFIDAHTHMDMPFGGTITADDWDSGTAAAVAGGTTVLVDFALQDIGGTLDGAITTWQAKATGRTRIDYGLHVAVCDLNESVKAEIPSLPGRGVCTVKVFMAYKGTPLYTPDEGLLEIMQIARDAGVMVMVHAENGDAVAKLQEQALIRGHVEPIWHARTRPEAVEAEATGRAIRLAEIADTVLGVVHVTCGGAADEIRRARDRGQVVHGETCPQYLVMTIDDLDKPEFEGAKYVCSPPLRDASNHEELWRALATGDLVLVGSDHCAFDFAGQKELGRGDFTRIPNGMPGVEERAPVLWTHGVRTGRISPETFVAVLSTNQARVHGLLPRKGLIAAGADADIVVWDPELPLTITHANRHNGNDYTPYEGLELVGAPARVYVRGNLAYVDGDVVAEPGSGEFLPRALGAGRETAAA